MGIIFSKSVFKQQEQTTLRPRRIMTRIERANRTNQHYENSMKSTEKQMFNDSTNQNRTNTANQTLDVSSDYGNISNELEANNLFDGDSVKTCFKSVMQHLAVIGRHLEEIDRTLTILSNSPRSAAVRQLNCGKEDYADSLKKMSASATPRKGHSDKQVDTDQEYWLYHRCIEDSVDIFADFEEDDEVEDKRVTINLGDLKIKQRQSKKPSKMESGTSSAEKERTSESESVSMHSRLLNVPEILKACGSTFENFNITMKNAITNDEMKNIEQDSRFILSRIRKFPQQIIINGTDFLNSLNVNGVKLDEKTIVIVIAEVNETTLNITINSTIASYPEKQSVVYWQTLMENSSTLFEALQNVIIELHNNLKIIEIFKLTADLNKTKKYTEMLNSKIEWENCEKLSKNQFPNRFNQESWANTDDLCTLGEKQLQCDTLCSLKKSNEELVEHVLKENCDFCNQKKSNYEMFSLIPNCDGNGESVKCSECLRKEFFQKFQIQHFPINLKLKIPNEYEVFSIFVPLTIVNLYCEKTIRKYSSHMKCIEKCPQCKTYLHFDKNAMVDNNFNVSCGCGYTWCQKCKNVPHWPMSCEVYKSWEQKWFLKYSLLSAVGTGSEYLLEVTCSCRKLIFYCLGPCTSIISPCCNRKLECEDIFEDWRCHRLDLPEECIHKLIKGMPDAKESIISYRFEKHGVRIIAKLSQVPNLKVYVTELCNEARKMRFSLEFQRKLKKELKLLQKLGFSVQDSEDLRKTVQTALYLMENVTAWSYEVGFLDRNLRMKLEKMTETQKTLMEHVNEKKINLIRTDVGKLREKISVIVQQVRIKLDNDLKMEMEYDDDSEK